jgi:glucosamine-phosphate N-acetyltransferase
MTDNNNNIIVREIELTDYKKGYIELLQSFANYETPITEEYFTKYITEQTTTKIVVIENLETERIIGAGTIYCMEKLHNATNRMGFIQDVVVDKTFRKKGLGKVLVDKLFEVGKANRCYKTILNCNPEVTGFYEKLGFTKKGFEFDKR